MLRPCTIMLYLALQQTIHRLQSELITTSHCGVRVSGAGAPCLDRPRNLGDYHDERYANDERYDDEPDADEQHDEQHDAIDDESDGHEHDAHDDANDAFHDDEHDLRNVR